MGRMTKVLAGMTIAMALLFLSGCAIVDCSSLDTAEVLQPRSAKIVLKQTTPICIENLMPEGITEEFYKIDKFPEMSLMQFGIGVFKDVEMDIEWSTLYPFGYCKIGGKAEVNTTSDLFKCAVAPAVSIGSSNNRPIVIFRDSDDSWESFTNYGLHGALLTSFTPCNFYSFTATVKLDYYQTLWKKHLPDPNPDGDYYVSDEGMYNNLNIGIYLTPRYVAGPLVFMPEIGWYIYQDKGRGRIVTPVFNLGLGVQAAKKK
jgi:hypothetical protein